MSRQIIILAGGAGTRLRARLGDLPKPMIPIAGMPLLEHQVELAKKYGFTDLIFFVHYRADLIEQYFGDGRKFGVRIRHVLETEPLGTAGAIFAGMKFLADRFMVMYGDTMVNVDLERLWQAHEKASATATLLLHPNDHPFDSDLVEVDTGSRVVAFHNRPHPANVWRQNLVNAGLYVLEKSALQKCAGVKSSNPGSKTVDFGKDIFPALVARGEKLFGYNSPEFIKDIGTPERYDRISAQFAAGIVQRSSLASPQRAVFLDRDGTIIPDKDCLRNADDLDLLPAAAAAIHQLNLAGWRTVMVTNQPVIAKGFCNEAELQRIHNKLESLLGLEHAFLDRLYFCPHHPEKGFPGERPDLKIVCDCRKPKTGMVKKAVADLNIDLSQSWFVGDTTTDVQTAKNAGVKSILLRTGCGGVDARHAPPPDFVAENLLDAVKLILKQEKP
jgi:histidinol-phosphate phosphatase family protein